VVTRDGVLIVVFVQCLTWGYAAGTQSAELGPRAGDVYKEYILHNSGDRAWRVTSPEARDSGAQKFLPNPIWELEIDDLEGAIRAEVMLDRWGGHLDTTNPAIRFNKQEWLSLAPPSMGNGVSLPENYYFQDNPVIAVPLEHLKEGKNTIEGICGHKKPGGWGQWGLYSLMLRVYFDPTKKPHLKGRIVSPLSQQTIEENPVITIAVDKEDQLDRIEVFAWYEGYDENGDGRFLDWHGGWYQPNRNEPAEWRDHVGTVLKAPLQVTWNTRWVPDQPPGQIRLIARIRDKSGTWSVTEEVTGLTLHRPNETVTLHCVRDFPPEFGVRVGQRRSCSIRLPESYNPEAVVEAGLHYRTWHGWDKHHAPYKLNDYERPHEGNNHHYHYHIHSIPPQVLRPGDNIFEIFSETDHHMLEILWPGPALIIRAKK